MMFRLSLLLLLPSLIQAGTKTFNSGNFHVSLQIKGPSGGDGALAGVPRYVFWTDDDPNNNLYQVLFSKVYEKKNGNKVGGSNVALAPLGWQLEFEDTDDAESVVFWINGTDNKKERLETLAFRNEIVSGSRVKFDVFMKGYEWKESDSDSLDMEWKMSNTSKLEVEDEEEDDRRLQDGDEPAEQNDDSICFFGSEGDDSSEVCWGIEEEATAGGNKVGVSLDYSDDGFIVVSYDNWGNEDLHHDPSFGLSHDDDACAGVFFLFLPFCLIWNFFLSLFNLN